VVIKETGYNGPGKRISNAPAGRACQGVGTHIGEYDAKTNAIRYP
jgi:hypothetical protein